MAEYFRATPDPDRGWALAALTDGLPFSFPLRRTLGEMVARRIDPELYRLSRDYVGDTAETIALLWPDRRARPSPRLAAVVAALALRHRIDRAGADRRDELGVRLETWLDGLDATGRWALLKLLTGALRVGVSARLAKTALAEMAGHPRRRHRGDVARAGAALRAACSPGSTAAGPRPDVSARARIPAADAVAPARGRGLGRARSRRVLRPNGNGTASACRSSAHAGEAQLFSRTGDDIGRSFPDIVGGFQLQRRARWRAAGRARRRRRAVQRPAAAPQPQGRVASGSCEQYPAHVRLYELLIDGRGPAPAAPSPSAARGWRPGTRSIARPAPTSPLIDAASKDELHRDVVQRRATPASRA